MGFNSGFKGLIIVLCPWYCKNKARPVQHGKGYRRISFTYERVGMFSIVQESPDSFTIEIFTKTTWISLHKTEQKFRI